MATNNEKASTLIQPGDNPDITEERLRATFSVWALAEFFHGGADVLRRRAEIRAFVDSVPDLREPIPLEFLSRAERYDEQARRAIIMTNIGTEVIDGSDYFGEGMYFQSLIMGRDSHALHLHYVMFLPTLQNQCDAEQLDVWLPRAISREILGTYAQTEMGHGTNLSRLETTATYDPIAQQFVLHSPTLTATKWWPGSLGKTANHAIVMAQLWTRGKCHGPHPFVVQLRDLETHQPLEGITVGDIGPKMGFNGGDNGFLHFNKHRIPCRNMLMRYAKVLPSGEYVPAPHARLSYGSMVQVRAAMIRDQAMHLGAAATIAVRYSAVRRQGELPAAQSSVLNIVGDEQNKKPASIKMTASTSAPTPASSTTKQQEEVRVLDYVTQQQRLLPSVAATWAFLCASTATVALYRRAQEHLMNEENSKGSDDGNGGGGERNGTNNYKQLLASLHVLSSGMKAVVTWEVAKGIEQCRLACGGHGYSEASGLPQIYGFASAGCTYEGENIVMLLQVAKHLMKLARNLVTERRRINGGTTKEKNSSASINDLTDFDRYLAFSQDHNDAEVSSKNNTDNIFKREQNENVGRNHHHYLRLFEKAARAQIFATFSKLEAEAKRENGKYKTPSETNTMEENANNPWNRLSVELCRCARLHIKCFILRCVIDRIGECSDPQIQPIVADLGALFAVFQICQSDPLSFMRVISVEEMEECHRTLYALLARLRPNAVAIVDSFDFADRELRSVLGRRDGRVYEALYKWAKASPLNQKEVSDTFHRRLKPMMDEGRQMTASKI